MVDILSLIYRSNWLVIALSLFVFSLLLKSIKTFFKFKKYFNLVVSILITFYLFFILYVTLISRFNNRICGRSFCLIPFYSYHLALTTQSGKLRESILNILFFYPLGYLFGSLNIEKINSKRWIIIPIACALSFIIELSQYIFKLGYAEVDDVIHNTLGCAIGLLMCILLERLFKIKKDGKSDE